MAELKDQFINGMSYAAATVNIVTTDGPAGRSGVTVSAMSSVSADTANPTLLVCINDASSGAAPIIENGVFCVNILRDDQSFVSDTFAGRYGDKGEEKFACAEWETLATGAPASTDALVSFDCKLTNDVIVGTHHVFFGEVQEMRVAPSGMPLIYANRAYGTPFRLAKAALERSSGLIENEAVRISCLNSFAPFFLPGILQHVDDENSDVAVEVIEGDQAQVLHSVAAHDAELALVYDLDIADELSAHRLMELRPYVLLPADHALAGKNDIALEQLAQEPLILLDAPLSRDYFLSLFSDMGIEPNIGMRTSSFELIRSMVANGSGYSIFVTRPAAMTSYDGKPLVAVPIAGEVKPIALALVVRKDTNLSKSAERLAGGIRQYFLNRSEA